MTTLEDLDRIAPGAVEITGAEPNDVGDIRLTVTSTEGLADGDYKKVAGVQGTAEANGYWVITVVDGTHIDLQGSIFMHPYEGGGFIAGSIDALDSVITSLDHV